ncbi:hypothetical protein [Parachryseolinea silvisoli]|uniref:hypothetical protein n=1 Tax=Parachryseolinea silvisoli TaxID=2873601 RepID=UPI00226589B3|nr:hypothetical protein [Parachryseolinea silvisoli]MCD9019867.1 hypothetical protein [Parachryseolinea silvisoli]
MKSAYNATWLHNLSIVKEVKQWRDYEMLSQEQFLVISSEYPSSFYHPNVIIRILLFLATLIALAGVTGLGALVVFNTRSNEEYAFGVSLVYGIVSFIFLDRVFIYNAKHYKSGVTEALLYHALGYTLVGIAGMTEWEPLLMASAFFVVFSIAAFRYIDLISTACAFASLAFLLFYVLYDAGGYMQQIIPMAVIALFTPLYFAVKKIKAYAAANPWRPCLTLLEALSLLLIYAAGNYFVVRELSLELMDLVIEEGQDIPFAYVFYSLTVAIPVGYLYFGIKRKDLVLIRVSLLAIAFSVVTFKYYFSLGHPEISLTAAGAVLLTVSLLLFRYLKSPKYGYTRENVLREKWSDMNIESFVIAQSLGGNTGTVQETGGGGDFAGGGSTDSF